MQANCGTKATASNEKCTEHEAYSHSPLNQQDIVLIGIGSWVTATHTDNACALAANPAVGGEKYQSMPLEITSAPSDAIKTQTTTTSSWVEDQKGSIQLQVWLNEISHLELPTSEWLHSECRT